jgi:hypothetical protein
MQENERKNKTPRTNSKGHTNWKTSIEYLVFYVPLKNISLIWRRHHYIEGLRNLGQSSALRDFEQGGILIVPHLL